MATMPGVAAGASAATCASPSSVKVHAPRVRTAHAPHLRAGASHRAPVEMTAVAYPQALYRLRMMALCSATCNVRWEPATWFPGQEIHRRLHHIGAIALVSIASPWAHRMENLTEPQRSLAPSRIEGVAAPGQRLEVREHTIMVQQSPQTPQRPGQSPQEIKEDRRDDRRDEKEDRREDKRDEKQDRREDRRD